MRITILTSRLNYGWISMEEIITWIEDSWKRWAADRNVECKIFMAEDISLTEFFKASMKSEFIVVTCFNIPVARALKGLRGNFGVQVPWVYYLHGLASFGCWPLFQWGIGELLMTQDLFIGSCRRDKTQFELVFKNIECQIIPFSLNIKKPIPQRKPDDVIRLAFIGRISSQKNLHTLLVAVSQLRQKFELHFFGKADDYGSPLVGRREKNYPEYLERVASELGLKNVIFHGFMKREEIESMMDKDLWTFIAPSIHSDENFGMAAFRCLLNGHKVILSDWGGHADYPEHFSSQVKLLPVKSSEIGPYISVDDISSAIETFCASSFKNGATSMPDYYTEETIHNHFDMIASRMDTKKTALKVATHPLLEIILKRRAQYFSPSGPAEGAQIFENYSDEYLKVFYRAYGMRDVTESEKDNIVQVPWVTASEDGYTVNDPHRGIFQLKDETDLLNCGLLYSKK